MDGIMLRRRVMMAKPYIPYQRVAYLENSNYNQYIDAYHFGNAAFSIFDFEIRMRFSSYPTQNYDGCGITTNGSAQFFIAANSNSATGIYMCFGPNSTGTLVKQLVNSDKTGWHTYRVVSDGVTCTYYVDGIQVFQHNKCSVNLNPYNFRLFHIHGGIGTNGKTQVERAKFSLSGTPIFDLYAVRDGQTGYMYDTVTRQLFGNNGPSGSFTVGPDV